MITSLLFKLQLIKHLKNLTLYFRIVYWSLYLLAINIFDILYRRNPNIPDILSKTKTSLLSIQSIISKEMVFSLILFSNKSNIRINKSIELILTVTSSS